MGLEEHRLHRVETLAYSPERVGIRVQSHSGFYWFYSLLVCGVCALFCVCGERTWTGRWRWMGVNTAVVCGSSWFLTYVPVHIVYAVARNSSLFWFDVQIMRKM
jgi:4-amino-4-deoxy-L-arabinose transferase-like glycosyltransferase